MIQATKFNQGVFEVMKEGKHVAEQLQSEVNADELADLLDEIQGQKDKMGELDDLFADVANNDKDELMDELEELMVLDEMDNLVMPGVDAIAAKKPYPTIKMSANKPNATKDEEEELAAMLAM